MTDNVTQMHQPLTADDWQFIFDVLEGTKLDVPRIRSEVARLHREAGQPLTKAKLRRRFDAAREAAAQAAPNDETAARLRAIQFRDLRAKAATDVRAAAGLDAAQGCLGIPSQR